MVKFAERILGPTSCKIFKAVVRKTEPSVFHCEASSIKRGKDADND